MSGVESSAQGESDSRGDAIDLMRLIRALVARKRWILAPTALAFAAALASVTLLSPRYTSVAKVLLENQDSYLTRPDKAGAENLVNYDTEGVQSLAETVATFDLARKAVVKLGLAQNAEFNPSHSGGVFSKILSLISGGRRDESDEDRATETFLSRLTVFPDAKSRVLQIEFVSSDAALAARGANTMATLFLAEQEQARKDSARAAAAWLSGKIEQLRAKVADADSKAEAFRATSGLLTGANGLTINNQQLAEINAQIASARATQTAAASKAQMLREMLRAGRLDAVPDVAKDESLRRYAELRVNLKAQIAEQSRTLLPGHPHMKELNGQLAGLDEEIRAAAQKAVGGLEDESKLAAAQLRNLEGAVAKQSQTVADSNSDEVKLRALELDAKTAREQLESYTAKYREAVAHDADNAAPPNARIIETARAAVSPTFPKTGPTLLLATLAGFLISAGVVAAHVLMFDETPARNRDAPQASPPESAPAVAQALSAPEAPIVARDSELNGFLDRLARTGAGEGGLTLLVTGQAEKGALGVALGAARRLSGRGRTLLLDLGATQPWLEDTLDRADGAGAALPGLAEVFAGRATIDEALHRDLSSRLDVLPAGAGEIDPQELLDLLEALNESYEFVVAHASDWRSPEAEALTDAIAAIVVCAPIERLAAVEMDLRRRFDEPSLVTLGVALARRSKQGEAA